MHKDRTLLTAFRIAKQKDDDDNGNSGAALHPHWYVLNCHLQAGKQAPRRVRQINEGIRSVLTLARKLKGTKKVCEKGEQIRVRMCELDCIKQSNQGTHAGNRLVELCCF